MARASERLLLTEGRRWPLTTARRSPLRWPRSSVALMSLPLTALRQTPLALTRRPLTLRGWPPVGLPGRRSARSGSIRLLPAPDPRPPPRGVTELGPSDLLLGVRALATGQPERPGQA